MSDLIDTTEMYLKTVFELLELGITPMRARIAERLGQSGPTVSQTVGRMERDGLLYLDDSRVIHLTEEGRGIAGAVMRKHRLAERHLMDVLGLEYELVHDEACRWEHVMSEDVERKIAAMLTPPYADPYGNPIPGLAALGVTADGSGPHGGRRLGDGVQRLVQVELPEGGEVELTVDAIGEVIQSDVEFLRDLKDCGIVPGARVTVASDADSLVMTGPSGREITLTPSDAGHICVTQR
ncbi:FeoA domain-containing protein [Helcobacillus massiliensis]|uniref:metal-dependent transcriptional regulator n=1 Tax=Helcobacillus TaxID=1161125 RepID=UPI001EF6C40F|nr:metal-dependent transcriptional regulator [Helcobacillus massiliensis]MCG7426041.1 FeoA domain-containing protein [Helcobacillus sp. ACRRO]MCT1558391.1 FeoA domain-containing protein [Helcobacillus massiliensis]MCT2036837.1 FeoA domain-containing protein [Helcobacillus massiliensis]MCT2332618.1 FeoA domain-containing protein [Helcobacillus massiliensis]